MQPAASAGPILRVAIAAGKFQGVISSAMPIGACATSIRLVPLGRDREVAVGAHGLLGEPAQELGGVGGLAARLGERLAHLAHDHARDLVVALGHQVERAAEDLGALARGARGPVLGGGRRGVHGGDAVLRAADSIDSMTDPSAGSSTGNRRRSVAMTMAGQ